MLHATRIDPSDYVIDNWEDLQGEEEDEDFYEPLPEPEMVESSVKSRYDDVEEAVSPREVRRREYREFLNGPAPGMEDEETEIEPLDPEELLFGQRIPFAELGLSQPLLKSLPRLGFQLSTRVQAAAIPMILEKDRRAVIINVETGSGKTLAFLLPAFELALRKGKRKPNSSCPRALIMVPGRELGHQVAMVARRLSEALKAYGHEITVAEVKRAWPKNKVPDILIATPRAAAEGLAPCAAEDEIVRRAALRRISKLQLFAIDEADLLLSSGSHSEDVKSIFVALSASFPDKPRKVLKAAQKFYEGGVPVEVLDTGTLMWKKGMAKSNSSGTFNVRYGPGDWERYVKRSRLRGPGMGLMVEYGPHVVMAAATLPTYHNGHFMGRGRDNKIYNSGIGSPDWMIKRWFPNALKISSEWAHIMHPCIVKQRWVWIPNEEKAGAKRQFPTRLEKMVEILKVQNKDVRTLVFANSPDACLAAEQALRYEDIDCVSMHSGRPFPERLEGLQRFGSGEVSIMVCSDLGARGLDLPICRHVLQLEFAGNVTDYIHRVGRTARAGRLSKVTNFWGQGDVSTRETIMNATNMGMDGTVPRRRGNRLRLARTRLKHKRSEMEYDLIRRKARIARAFTQRKEKEQENLDWEALSKQSRQRLG